MSLAVGAIHWPPIYAYVQLIDSFRFFRRFHLSIKVIIKFNCRFGSISISPPSNMFAHPDDIAALLQHSRTTNETQIILDVGIVKANGSTCYIHWVIWTVFWTLAFVSIPCIGLFLYVIFSSIFAGKTIQLNFDTNGDYIFFFNEHKRQDYSTHHSKITNYMVVVLVVIAAQLRLTIRVISPKGNFRNARMYAKWKCHSTRELNFCA